jgi:hypothetical protein
VTLGTIGLGAAFVAVFLLGYTMGHAQGTANGKLEVLEADHDQENANTGEGE